MRWQPDGSEAGDNADEEPKVGGSGPGEPPKRDPPVFAGPGSAGVPPALSRPHAGEGREGAGETPALPVGSVPNARSVPPGAKQHLDRIGPEKFAAWMRDHKRVLVTDTTMRDAHQSLLATRMRTFDIAAVAQSYAAGLPQLFSLECWGGATFDVSMRFLTEDPLERPPPSRQHFPTTLTPLPPRPPTPPRPT